jgi:TonB family protein
MNPSFYRAAIIVACALSVGSFAPKFVRAATPTDADTVSSYVDSVKASLDRSKHFPTGREVSIDQPSGRSEVTFALARSGKVTSVKTTQSSYSMPLDEMARALVHRAKYPAFPTAAWVGESTHTFVVAYNFSRNPTGKVAVGEPVEVKAQ